MKASGALDPGSNPGRAIENIEVKMRKAIRQIHKSLKKTHPHIVRKVTRPFKYRYPKITLLGILIVVAYFIFRNPVISSFLSELDNLSYLGIFIAGILFSYGFTAPFAVGLFLAISPENLPLAVIIGSLGSFFSDFLIFKIIKNSFMNEFKEIEETKNVKKFARLINNNLGKKFKLYLLYIFAGFILASPLPDEFGVTLLTGLGHIKATAFAILSFSTKALAIVLLFLI